VRPIIRALILNLKWRQRYTPGRASEPVIYSDYRALPGSAFQFSWLVTGADVQSTINVASQQPNAAIDAGGLRNLHRRGEFW
jgi:hypothetical protein